MTYAASNLSQNQQSADPELSDVLNIWAKNLLLNMACHHLGTIQSFNQALQTCTASVNYTQTVFQLNDQNNAYTPQQVGYPILSDVPVIVVGGALGALTLPIQQGDGCLLLFNDRDINNWYAGNTTGAVATPRLHNFSDSIALVGLRNLNQSMSNYDIVRSILRAGSGVIGVNSGNNKLLLSNDSPSGSDGNYSYSTTLGTMLQALCTQLEGLCTALETLTVSPGSFSNSGGAVTGTSGTPTNAGDISTISGNISAIATDLSGLLE